MLFGDIPEVFLIVLYAAETGSSLRYISCNHLFRNIDIILSHYKYEIYTFFIVISDYISPLSPLRDTRQLIFPPYLYSYPFY